MSQVERVTQDIIINALFLIGELGVGETPDAFMLSTGLEIINELLDGFSVDSIYIPFLTTYTFNFIPGKGTYSVGSSELNSDIVGNRIIDLSFANYTVTPASDQPIIYPIRIINKATLYNVVRLQNLNTRPGFVVLDKQPNQSFLIFYPVPDQPYLCEIRAKVMLDKLEINQDISELSPYYYGFMKYAVGREFRSYYPSANWPDTNEDKYQRYLKNITVSNETDLTIRPSVILDSPQPFYWPNITVY